MKLRIKKLNLFTGKPVCMIHEEKAKEMSLHVGNRVEIKIPHGEEIISVVDTVKGILKPNEILISEEIAESLSLKNNDLVEVVLSQRPHSIELIKKKLKGEKLNKKEIKDIIFNIANNSLLKSRWHFLFQPFLLMIWI
ncbi:MAG: hypothetical protein WC867_07420 [Candidatus Pacearchaeota archaeon]|jgi:anaerobic selenocysteine-containing dehydrogenase